MLEDEKTGIITIERDDELFPARLQAMPKAKPKKIYILGSIPDSDRPAIGIVGARNCTPYGRDIARMFAYRLAQAGVDIISGMALGIDGWSHQGALEAGGRTYAVLGSGVDVCYPSSHRKLYRSIIDHGGIISEYEPGTIARAEYFPHRNRIISALSDAILVVEARIKSGSLITADDALAQGKDVFVIPGRISDELSVGCNRLILQGAIPVLSPEDILDYLGVKHPTQLIAGLNQEESEVYELIRNTPIALMTLASKCQGSFANTQRIVRKLVKEKYVREVGKDRYARI